MKKTEPRDTTRYNVSCYRCGSYQTPELGTPLWWQAKRRADDNFLDALCISGEKCGCVEKQRLPDSPFRVFGRDLEHNFDIPFMKFTDAVKEFLELKKSRGYDVYIKGVSPRVERKLEWS